MKSIFLKSSGADIELIQSVLKIQGFYIDEINRFNSDGLIMAVKKYQEAHGLFAAGIIDSLTWKSLMPRILGYKIYFITKNDTMADLAIQFGSSIESIKKANHLSDRKLPDAGQKIIIPLKGNYIFTDISLTYKIMCLNILSLNKRFPFIRCEVIGKSVMGKNLFGLQIGHGKKHIMFNASHHGNEWITSVVLLKFIEDLAKASITDSEINGIHANALLTDSTIHCIPMVNPDGVDLVNGDVSPDSSRYKQCLSMNLPDIPFPEGWKSNINGIDLNVNYPALWETAKQIKLKNGYSRPGPREFPGEYPLSEPESKAMVEYTRKYDFRAVIALHTQGEEIYYKFNGLEPNCSYENALAFSSVSGYKIVDSPYESSFAGFKDWFISDFKKPGYTIEAGLGTNPLPITQFNEIYKSVSPILTLACMQ